MITEEADETHARRLLQCDVDDGNSISDRELTFPSIIMRVRMVNGAVSSMEVVLNCAE